MLTPNQLNLIADKLRMLRGRIHAELATTLRQSDSAHANDLRQQLQEIAADLQAIEEEHIYLRNLSERPANYSGWEPGTILKVPESSLACVVHSPGEGVEVYIK